MKWKSCSGPNVSSGKRVERREDMLLYIKEWAMFSSLHSNLRLLHTLISLLPNNIPIR